MYMSLVRLQTSWPRQTANLPVIEYLIKIQNDDDGSEDETEQASASIDQNKLPAVYDLEACGCRINACSGGPVSYPISRSRLRLFHLL